MRRRFFPAVEGMRGFAALSVLIGHVLFVNYGATGTRGEIGVWLGVLGVVVFFAISGFLLYRPFLAARHEGKPLSKLTAPYLVRRAVRIFPAYWVALTAGAAFAGLSGVFTGDWWIYYFLLQIYFEAKQLLGLPVAWTLCVELSFYLLLPLIALVLAKRGAGSRNRHALLWEFAALAALATAPLVFDQFIATDPDTVWLTNTIGGLLIWFVGGMMLAAIQVIHPASLKRFRWVLARPEICWPIGLALFLLQPLKVFPDDTPLRLLLILNPLLIALAALFILAPATLGDGGRVVRTLLTNRWIVFAGTISYGLYLWHLPIAVWLKAHWPDVVNWHPTFTLGGLTLIGAVIAATGSWYLVEKPLMQRVRSVKASVGIPRRRRPPAAEEEPAIEDKTEPVTSDAPGPTEPFRRSSGRAGAPK